MSVSKIIFHSIPPYLNSKSRMFILTETFHYIWGVGLWWHFMVMNGNLCIECYWVVFKFCCINWFLAHASVLTVLFIAMNSIRRKNDKGAAAVQHFYCVLVFIHAGAGRSAKLLFVVHAFMHVWGIKALNWEVQKRALFKLGAIYLSLHKFCSQWRAFYTHTWLSASAWSLHWYEHALNKFLFSTSSFKSECPSIYIHICMQIQESPVY